MFLTKVQKQYEKLALLRIIKGLKNAPTEGHIKKLCVIR